MALPRLTSRLFSPMRSSLCQLTPSISIAAARPFSSSPPALNQNAAVASKTDSLVELAKARRTIYQLGKNSPVPDSKIEELVNAAILNVPSAFNTQSTRLLVLLHREHERLWDVVIGVFQNLVKTGAIPEQVWQQQTLPKLEGFKAGVGTILFYEDPSHIKPFSEKFSLYKDQFQPWAEHSNAMHQYFLWTGLESLGFGANLQHYNPLIDAPVAKQWDVPSNWRLLAQLVFGSPEGSPGEKTQKPTEERVKIYGKQ
ncbi:Nitroreductase-like protein [Aspergillus pseudodeflectus]|uniref:Nitroreductase-like protein n=1 Tax=Aspergillus pseudodeflectus TaxID=176178 RepID=A0ABR4LB33_9EURO